MGCTCFSSAGRDLYDHSRRLSGGPGAALLTSLALTVLWRNRKGSFANSIPFTVLETPFQGPGRILHGKQR